MNSPLSFNRVLINFKPPFNQEFYQFLSKAPAPKQQQTLPQHSQTYTKTNFIQIYLPFVGKCRLLLNLPLTIVINGLSLVNPSELWVKEDFLINTNLNNDSSLLLKILQITLTIGLKDTIAPSFSLNSLNLRKLALKNVN